MSQGGSGGEAEVKGTTLPFVTDAVEFPAASGAENLYSFLDNRKLSGKFDEY